MISDINRNNNSNQGPNDQFKSVATAKSVVMLLVAKYDKIKQLLIIKAIIIKAVTK